jgi:hypothetical protein
MEMTSINRNGDERQKPIVLVETRDLGSKNLAEELQDQVRNFNKMARGRGLKKLRSFLNVVGGFPGMEQAKTLYHFVNGNPSDAVAYAKTLLSQTYDSPAEQFAASQIAMFVKKYPFPGSEDLATAAGTRKFLRGERKNRLVNRLMTKRRVSGEPDSGSHLHQVRSYVARLLGDAPDYQAFGNRTGWGPGSVVGVHGKFTHFAAKFLAEKWTCTAAALPYILTYARRSPMFWELLGFKAVMSAGKLQPTYMGFELFDVNLFDELFLARVEIVDYNKIAFVPKDANEYRTIASEPLLNQWIQKAIDEDMRLKLRRFGIDLRDQQRNQVLAREGSLGGVNPFCTIDLSNASGSLALETVRDALAYAPDWFSFLNAVRSPCYRMPGSETSVRYAGFVSMGNGFCFPLETIIFAAICFAAHSYTNTAPDFRCYGDDIVIRQNEALICLELLRRYGFKANADKTFLFGSFRESCGADWHSGEWVRPVVLDDSLDTFEELTRFHNALVRLPNRWAQPLSAAALGLLPPFANHFVRPFADHTDEAVDGRWLPNVVEHGHGLSPGGDPIWYGLVLNPVRDKDIVKKPGYATALYHAALQGFKSEAPFAARRETRVRVARLCRPGNTSSWLPGLATEGPLPL